MIATRTLPKFIPLLGAATGAVGSALLFVHLMQSNAAVNETVGNISPAIAGYFGCSCPFCSRNAACAVPPEEIGVRRLDATNIHELLGR